MTLDLVLAVIHHLLVFLIFGVLAGELIAVRRDMSLVEVARVARVDVWYGMLAGLVVAAGFCRAVFAAKGWAYYSHNLFFWTKIAAFVLIGLLSIAPTLAFVRWRRAGVVPDPAQVSRVRRLLWAELLLFVPLLASAAAMARGYGEYG